MATKSDCRKAIGMISEALEDEKSATKEYSDLSQSIFDSKINQYLKKSMISVIEKIYTDEKSHHKLLINIRDLLEKSCKL